MFMHFKGNRPPQDICEVQDLAFIYNSDTLLNALWMTLGIIPLGSKSPWHPWLKQGCQVENILEQGVPLYKSFI